MLFLIPGQAFPKILCNTKKYPNRSTFSNLAYNLAVSPHFTCFCNPIHYLPFALHSVLCLCVPGPIASSSLCFWKPQLRATHQHPHILPSQHLPLWVSFCPLDSMHSPPSLPASCPAACGRVLFVSPCCWSEAAEALRRLPGAGMWATVSHDLTAFNQQEPYNILGEEEHNEHALPQPLSVF